MNGSKSTRYFIGALIILAISSALFVFSIYSNQKAQSTLLRVVEESFKTPPPKSQSLDERILSTRRELQRASNEINNLRSRISIHATNAANQQTIAVTLRLLNDISVNSEKVVVQNQEIQNRLLDLTSLYEQKIEAIYNAKEASKESAYGLTFWVAIAGVIVSVSGMILAWRKDKRELLELEHKLRASPSQ